MDSRGSGVGKRLQQDAGDVLSRDDFITTLVDSENSMLSFEGVEKKYQKVFESRRKLSS